MKRALVLGIGGQDGSYLADILVERGVEVHGMLRHSSGDNRRRIGHLDGKVRLHSGDLTDFCSLQRVVIDADPEWVFNEADQDHVGYSKLTPLYSAQVTYGGVANLLEVLRLDPTLRECEDKGRVSWGRKLFQPLSATMFGDCPAPQDESTPLNPASPYACAKAGAWHLCRHYRREHGLDVRCAIMYSHDSPRRGGDYLLQRIARGEKIGGDLSTVVDIGYAREYMEAAVRIMELPTADKFFVGAAGAHDYVLGTGHGWRIENLVKGNGEVLKGWENLPNCLLAYRSLSGCKAGKAFGWNPQHDAMSVLKMLKEARDV